MKFVARRWTKDEFDKQCVEALLELEATKKIIRTLRGVNRRDGPEVARRVLRASALLQGVEV